ncbi:DUF7352 domain-containing protein, partial [Escherichia coli]
MKVKLKDNPVDRVSWWSEGTVYEIIAPPTGPDADMKFGQAIDDDGDVSNCWKEDFDAIEEAPQADQWDASRGPKMADPKGKAIFKYQMPVLEQFEMKLPQGALIIRMEDQGGMFWLWAVVDTRAPDETRKFRAFKTGASIPDNFDG